MPGSSASDEVMVKDYPRGSRLATSFRSPDRHRPLTLSPAPPAPGPAERDRAAPPTGCPHQRLRL
ncbi:hypothetical protein GCM10010518_50350 [Kitasatospora cinereorecta]